MWCRKSNKWMSTTVGTRYLNFFKDQKCRQRSGITFLFSFKVKNYDKLPNHFKVGKIHVKVCCSSTFPSHLHVEVAPKQRGSLNITQGATITSIWIEEEL